MNVLITGGIGFIGSSLAQRCIQDGSRVTLFDSMDSRYGSNSANIAGIEDRVSFVHGDTRDFDHVCSVIHGQNVIVDCAAQVSHELSMKDPLDDFSNNCGGASNIAEAWKRYAPQAKLIYAGTRGQKGIPVRTPVDESHPSNPPDFNGLHKQMAQDVYFFYAKKFGLDARSVLINNVYGPRCSLRTDYGWVNKWIGMAIQNQDIVVKSDGSQTRDYSYVDDVVSAFLCVMKRGVSCNEYLIGSGEEVSVRDILGKIVKHSKSSSRISFEEMPQHRRDIEIGRFVVDSSKLKSIGWSPEVSLDDGLQRTIHFYRERWEEYKP